MIDGWGAALTLVPECFSGSSFCRPVRRHSPRVSFIRIRPALQKRCGNRVCAPSRLGSLRANLFRNCLPAPDFKISGKDPDALLGPSEQCESFEMLRACRCCGQYSYSFSSGRNVLWSILSHFDSHDVLPKRPPSFPVEHPKKKAEALA